MENLNSPNWIMASREVFEDPKTYNIPITRERLLSNGQYIKHMSHCNNMQVTAKDDPRVTFWTTEALEALLQYVEE